MAKVNLLKKTGEWGNLIAASLPNAERHYREYLNKYTQLLADLDIPEPEVILNIVDISTIAADRNALYAEKFEPKYYDLRQIEQQREKNISMYSLLLADWVAEKLSKENIDNIPSIDQWKYPENPSVGQYGDVLVAYILDDVISVYLLAKNTELVLETIQKAIKYLEKSQWKDLDEIERVIRKYEKYAHGIVLLNILLHHFAGDLLQVAPSTIANINDEKLDLLFDNFASYMLAFKHWLRNSEDKPEAIKATLEQDTPVTRIIKEYANKLEGSAREKFLQTASEYVYFLNQLARSKFNPYVAYFGLSVDEVIEGLEKLLEGSYEIIKSTDTLTNVKFQLDKVILPGNLEIDLDKSDQTVEVTKENAIELGELIAVGSAAGSLRNLTWIMLMGEDLERELRASEKVEPTQLEQESKETKIEIDEEELFD